MDPPDVIITTRYIYIIRIYMYTYCSILVTWIITIYLPAGHQVMITWRIMSVHALVLLVLYQHQGICIHIHIYSITLTLCTVERAVPYQEVAVMLQ